MKISVFSVKTLPRDKITGIIIALVSIPISIGYARVAAGFRPPYTLGSDGSSAAELPYGNADRLGFEWAFGDKAEEKIEKYTEKLLRSIGSEAVPPEQQLMDIIKSGSSWKGVGELDGDPQ